MIFMLPVYYLSVILYNKYSYNTLVMYNYVTIYLVIYFYNMGNLYFNNHLYTMNLCDIYNSSLIYSSYSNIYLSLLGLSGMKLHFKYRGGWVFKRVIWPYIFIFRLGYSCPIHILLNLFWFSITRRYMFYSSFMLLYNDLTLLLNTVSLLYCVSGWNIYTKRGMKLSSKVLLLNYYKNRQMSRLIM